MSDRPMPKPKTPDPALPNEAGRLPVHLDEDHSAWRRMSMWLAKRDAHSDERWLPLATYNAEVARGIVHTPEYDAKMAEEQAKFNAECREFGCHDPDLSSRYDAPKEG